MDIRLSFIWQQTMNIEILYANEDKIKRFWYTTTTEKLVLHKAIKEALHDFKREFPYASVISINFFYV